MTYFSKASWKTTSIGLTLIAGSLTTIGFDIANHALTQVSLMVQIIAFINGMGFLVARDNDKSDEQVSAGNVPPPIPSENYYGSKSRIPPLLLCAALCLTLWGCGERNEAAPQIVSDSTQAVERHCYFDKNGNQICK